MPSDYSKTGVDGIGRIIYENDYSKTGDEGIARIIYENNMYNEIDPYIFPIIEMQHDIDIFDPKSEIINNTYRPKYDYASVDLTSYNKTVDDSNKFPVSYELMVLIDGKYHLLERFNTTDGVAKITNLKIGTTYYISAVDQSGEYKTQTTKITPTEKDQDIVIQFVDLHNGINNTELNITFFLKNIIDPEPYVYMNDNPKLKIISRGDRYTITGTPSNRIITLNVDQYRNGLLETSEFEITINGNTTALRTIDNIYYEAPYRILKQLNPDIDAVLSTNPNYSRVMVQSKKNVDRNLENILYISNGVGYTKDINFDYTTTFKLSYTINKITDSFKIKELDGDLNNDVIIVVGDERMQVISYSNATNIIVVKRGVDGNIPLIHDVDKLVFVESLNVSEFDFPNTTSKINITSRTFSNEATVNPVNDYSITPVGLANKPYPPINVKINDEYFTEIIEGRLYITWNGIKKNHNDAVGWYSDIATSFDQNTKVHLIITEYNRHDDVLDTHVIDADGIYEYAIEVPDINLNTYKYKIELFSVRNNIRSLHTFNQEVIRNDYFTAPVINNAEYFEDLYRPENLKAEFYE